MSCNKYSIGHLFYLYGRTIGRHPYPFVILPIISTIFLCSGFFFIKFDNDVRFLYSPENSESRREYAIHQRFTGDSIDTTYTAVSINSNSVDENLLQPQNRILIQHFLNQVLHNLTVPLGNSVYLYGEHLCKIGSYCRTSNMVVDEMLKLIQSNESPNRPSNYKYQPVLLPVMRKFDTDFYLGTHVFDTTTTNGGELLSANMIHLVFIVKTVPTTMGRTDLEGLALSFESQLQRLISVYPTLKIRQYSARILRNEVHKNTTYTLPYVSVTVVLLVVFTCVSLITGDSLTTKSIEGLLGIASSSMAMISAAGLLFLCGMPFISQVAVVPFVALAIGIDDTYIILGAWQRTNRRASVDVRLGHTMREAGLAITVTSLTDCLSFAIGALSSTPAISIFCTFMAAAIAGDFIYQITMFPAVVAISGRFEEKNLHCILKWRRIDEKYAESIRRTNSIGGVDDWFARVYGPMITHPSVRYVTLIVYAAYACGAVYGCSLLTPNLKPSTLVVDDSPIKAYIEQAESQVWSASLTANVYVNNTPDLFEERNRNRLMKFARELETLPDYALGSHSTQLGLRTFITSYWPFIYHTNSTFYRNLREFLSLQLNSHFVPNIHWRNDSIDCQHDCIDSLHWTTSFKIKDWRQRTDMLLAWRRLTSHYSDMQIVVYDEQNFYTDQTIALPYTTLSSLAIAITAMTIICICFIRDVTIVVWVSLSLLSMDVGIAGYLSLMGADLDTTTVVNILMSIGLSVDFTTHIGYRIHRSRAEHTDWSANRIVCDALGAVGWPVCQGGISTLLSIIVMLAVKSHVVRMFSRTAILVVVVGLFHGLVVLPVLLAVVMDVGCRRKEKRRNNVISPVSS